MNEKYKNILDMPHHISPVRNRMSNHDRAAQFAPYSALSGYEDAVEETARLTDRKIELDEYEKEKINATLITLLAAPPDTRVSITSFYPDERKQGGAYITIIDEFAYVEEVTRSVCLVSAKKVFIDDILEIKILD